MQTPADDAMTILVGTDFSEAARKAADAAVALAAASRALLILVHIHHPLVAPDMPQLAKDATEAARRALESEAERLRESGVQTGCEMMTGNPGRKLLEVAERYHAGLLVLGSVCRKSAGERWLMGDVAEYVAEHANVPTLIVRHAEPLVKWATKREPLKILIGENLREPSDNPLLWVKGLAEIAPFRATVAYVMWPYDEAMRYGYPPPISYLDTSPEVARAVARDLEHRVAQVMGELTVDTTVKASWGAADLSLANLAKEKAIDLLVVGTRQHRRLSRFIEHSVSRAVIHDTPANLAIVPHGAVPRCRPPLPRFERVLVATDFSAEANRAIPYAYALAAPGGVVCLAHVCHAGEAERLAAETRLRTLVPPESQASGVRSEFMTAGDDKVPPGILHLANRFGADVVCMASHSVSGLGEAIGKSSSHDLLRAIRVPVLLVHAEGG